MTEQVWYYDTINKICRRSNCTEERAATYADSLREVGFDYMIYFLVNSDD